MQDLIIQVDENNNVIGLRPREDFYEGKFIHRSSHLLLFNSQSNLAIMKRSSSKRWYPNQFTFSVDGTVDDETTVECMKREIKEEIGLDLEFKELFTFRNKDNTNDEFATVFFEISDNKITPDEKEISEVKWVKLDWLKEDMANNSSKYTNAMLGGMKVYWEKYGTQLPF
ncbi:MAG TPA: NUDIX domain-containing protein [Candidatus Paceibacterota bacterium]|jgi:isopentenyldiphosphate isomerase|nr:NUDIX domain-containing protein [Candidatus Paceibacterota bacterium]